MNIDWDPAKDRANQVKHGIRFDDAIAVFDDPDRVDNFDEGDYGEDRWNVVGAVGALVIFVVYTERDGGVRLISARKAAPHEEARYRSRRTWR